MEFDFSKLKGRIKEKGYTQENVAKRLNVSVSTFNLKINGNAFFTQEELYEMSNMLEIPKEDFYNYFFTQKVEKTKQN